MSFFFFFNDTATTEIYTLSLHDALPILFRFHHLKLAQRIIGGGVVGTMGTPVEVLHQRMEHLYYKELWDVRNQDRKSTRLNSSHGYISYAVFCLKKKKALRYLAVTVVSA